MPTFAAHSLVVATVGQAETLFGERGDIIITAIVVVSLLGTVNIQMLSAPCRLLATGRHGLCVPQATYVNRGGTPRVVLALSTVMAGASRMCRVRTAHGDPWTMLAAVAAAKAYCLIRMISWEFGYLFFRWVTIEKK